MGKKKEIAILIIAVILAGGAGFMLGRTTKSVSPFDEARGEWNGMRSGVGGGEGRMMRPGTPRGPRGNMLIGEVITIDASGMTVKKSDGGSSVVFLSPSTSIMTSASGTPADITVGKRVMVSGATNADGSFTASNVSVSQ